MTDKKLTDSEIVKALNQCTCSETNCHGCPYWDASNCSDRLCMDALALINRLQAENERLKEEIEILHSDYTYKFVKSKAKAEAYKECIEKLKSIFGEWIDSYNLDNLLKELVGDTQ